jgi:5'-nucleotidase / UDP-sugar diphosphatase
MKTQAKPAITLRIVGSLEEVTRKGVPHVVDFTVLQLNDAYEAAPVEGGRLGGLARVATLQRRLKQESPNFFSIMVGDFLAPSAIGATTGDSGKHMIEALNSMGLDYATVGNHEFDLSEADFLTRVEESRFKWIVSNVMNAKGEPLHEDIAKNVIIEFSNAQGEKVRVALIAVCLETKKPWLSFVSPIESAKQEVAELDSKCDVFLAMTHLTIQEDKQLGTEVPRLDVLFGGHEHEAAKAIVGEDHTPIFKADSNARSAFVHRFRYNTKTRVTDLFSEFVVIDDRFEPEPETDAIVKRWEKITYDTLRAQGNDPLEVVGRTAERLDGYEVDVRSKPTNLTRLLLETFLAEVPDADCAIFVAGNIRIDGVIPPGDITYFDVVRIFPMGGKLSVLNIPGSVLRALLDMGEKAKGQGGFYQHANISKSETGGWLVKGEPIVDDKLYKTVSNDIPAAYFSYPPFKGSATAKLYDTREVRAILTDRLRRDMAKASA